MLFIGWTAPAHGHRVMVFAYVEGGTIHTESSFGGGSPVRGGTIEVYDTQENKLLTGITDDEGRFSFPLDFPVAGDLKVVVLAGMGHTAHWIVRAAEMASGDPPVAPAAASAADDLAATAQPASAFDGVVADSGLDAATVERIVRQALDRRIGALEAHMAARQAPWRDIVAGIGYIFGLVGVATYMRYRPKRTP
ncbi:hypothetical protein [Desulfatitalea alkaliphila]|uniref:Nickel transport protein n=1 Tax=Desulfatitalea alkaliphila TaxID=2929485 RepID=A0AA41R0K9_9BACT|nr:hypothetical protein [Desulfatitalea alkaliphila]MCJ8499356.1 hypothetical protein [Desulfatitalea alkaliphila]